MTMNAVIPTDVSSASDTPFRPNRVPVGSPTYNPVSYTHLTLPTKRIV